MKKVLMTIAALALGVTISEAQKQVSLEQIDALLSQTLQDPAVRQYVDTCAGDAQYSSGLQFQHCLQETKAVKSTSDVVVLLEYAQSAAKEISGIMTRTNEHPEELSNLVKKESWDSQDWNLVANTIGLSSELDVSAFASLDPTLAGQVRDFIQTAYRTGRDYSLEHQDELVGVQAKIKIFANQGVNTSGDITDITTSVTNLLNAVNSEEVKGKFAAINFDNLQGASREQVTNNICPRIWSIKGLTCVPGADPTSLGALANLYLSGFSRGSASECQSLYQAMDFAFKVGVEGSNGYPAYLKDADVQPLVVALMNIAQPGLAKIQEVCPAPSSPTPTPPPLSAEAPTAPPTPQQTLRSDAPAKHSYSVPMAMTLLSFVMVQAAGMRA